MSDYNKYLREILTKVKASGLKIYTKNWKSGGYESAGSFINWQPRQRSYNHPILRDTRTAINSLRADKLKGSVKFEVTAPYMIYHQTGSGHLPERPVLYESEKINRAVKSHITETLEEFFKGTPKEAAKVRRIKLNM